MTCATFGDGDDLVRLVGRYVPLEPTGSQWRGPCPFHDDAFGALYVVPAKGFYHCFGCGEHGNSVRFLRRVEGISFRDAMRWLGWERGSDGDS